jgi:hypothetical protein
MCVLIPSGFTLQISWYSFSIYTFPYKLCVAFERWHFYSFNVFSNVVLNSFSLL